MKNYKNKKNSFKKTITVTLMFFYFLFSNMPLGLFDFLIEKINERNIVDVIWKSQHNKAVVDSFKINQATAAESAVDTAILDSTDEFGPSPSTVFTTDQIGYVFYIDGTSQNLGYSKTTNGGTNWGAPVVINTAVTGWTAVSVWYDQWTPGDTTGTKIHIAASDDASDDIHYTFLDTSGDVLKGSMISAVSGTATLTESADGPPSITKGGGGDLFISANFTSAAGGKVSKSSDGAGNTWTNITPGSWSSVAIDQIQLLPLSTDDDIVAIKAETATNAIKYQIYDEVANTWAGSWTNIATLVENTTYDQWFSATLKKTTGDIYLSFANQTNNAANDIEFWSFPDSGRTWTKKADVVTNSSTTMMPVPLVDENNGNIYVAYLQGTLAATMKVYYKYSTDNGNTWSVQSVSISPGMVDDHKSLRGNLLSDDILYVVWHNDDLNDLMGNVIPFASILVSPPTVTTQAVTDIADTTATGNGNVTSDGGGVITERGFVWNTSTNPTTSNSNVIVSGTTGTFTGNITGLSSSTFYYVRAYAINSAGTSYGNEVIFTTLTGITLPTVTTPAVSNITATTATGNGNITNTGNENNDLRGVVYHTGTHANPGNVAPGSSLYPNKVEASGSFTTGAFTSNITGLTGNTTYYVRAYSHNSAGYFYGDEVSFVATVPLKQISGTLTSSVFDTTANTTSVGYNSIMWKGTLGGVGEDEGKVRFQLAASNSSTGPWNYYGGPTCGSLDWFDPQGPNKPIELKGQSCLSAWNNKRYYRYKVQICSNDCVTGGPNTPTISSVIVNWSP